MGLFISPQGMLIVRGNYSLLTSFQMIAQRNFPVNENSAGLASEMPPETCFPRIRAYASAGASTPAILMFTSSTMSPVMFSMASRTLSWTVAEIFGML